MPSNRDYLEYVLDNLRLLDDISYKQMMGEYIIYYHNKIIGGIYDNRFLVKDTKSVYSLIKDVKNPLPVSSVKLIGLFPQYTYGLKLTKSRLELIKSSILINLPHKGL